MAIDANGFKDNLYQYHLLDWGQNGFIAVGLQNTMYLLDILKKDSLETIDVCHESNSITALKWLTPLPEV